MSELKTAEQHNAPFAGKSELHEHPVDFNSYLRRCLYVFIAVLCAMSLMIWTSYLPTLQLGGQSGDDSGRRLRQRLCRRRLSHALDFREEDDLHRCSPSPCFFSPA